MEETDWQQRTKILTGEESALKLAASTVAVIGLGGVGAYAAEMLCRAGIGHLILLDSDCINVTNKNRQLPALDSTIGMSKCKVMSERLKDINGGLKLTVIEEYLEPSNVEYILGKCRPDYLIDAIDTLSPKIALIKYCHSNGIPHVSSMGAGAKTDPLQVKIADISKTSVCALAKAVRKRLRGMGIVKGIPVVFSTELSNPEAIIEVTDETFKRTTTGTVSYMPAIFGCYLASYVIRNI